MIKSIFRIMNSACLLFVCGGVLAWSSAAYSAVAPVVSTLSAISEGSVTPVRVAADQYGNYYVTDPRGGGVLKYNSAGTKLQTITTSSKNVLGIALAQNGDILVSQGTVVAVYSSAGTYLNSFGTFGMANGITVDDTGAIYIADSKNNNVTVYNVDYSLKTTFGSTGSGAGQFKQPTGITYEKVSKQVAVVDALNGRVQFFTTAGVHQKTVGSFGSGPLKFTSPQAIAFEYSSGGTVLSRMYVVDSFQANVQVIDATSSSFLRYVGSYGLRSGQLVTPGDILLDSFNRLVIPNGAGTLVLFGVEGSTSGSSTGGTVITIPSTGSSAPVLVLTSLGTIADTISSITKTGSITVSGTVSPVGSSVSVNGVAANIDASGKWTAGVVLTQQGLNNIVVSASNSGSTSAVSAYITLDSAVPVVSAATLPQTGSTTNTPIQTVLGTVSDTTATSVKVTVTSGSQTVSQIVPVNDGVFSTAITLASGPNSITVVATDAAGSSTTTSSTVTYNPLAPAVTVATPSGAVSASASYTVSGTAPANSTITVNGVSQTVPADSTQWSAAIPLVPGLNPITITASVAGNTVTSTLPSSVVYAPGQPSLAVTAPVVDSATAKALSLVSGTASVGASVTASLNGVTAPVTVAADGSFTVSLPKFTSAGTYTVTITAIDSNGKTSSTARSLVYDPIPPDLTVLDTTAASIKISTSKGIMIAKDINGPIAAASNGTATLDLTGAVGATGAAIDQASLNIYALSPTGVSSRDGDINLDGKVDIADALLAAQISLGTVSAVSFEQRLHGDVGPLVNHTPVPDGRIRLNDVILILQKSVGIDW